MIVRDHRPTTKPAARPAGGPLNAPPPPIAPASGEARGATAFQWTQSLTYDEAARKATVLGDVVIAHRPDAADGLPIQVRADQAVALFDDKPPATRPATGPAGAAVKVAGAGKGAGAGKPADEAALAAIQLKRLSLTGHLTVLRAGAEMTAQSAEYDPATGWLVALGSRTDPARYADANGQQAVLAEQIHLNALTWRAEFVNVRGRAGTDRPTIPPRR